MSYPVYIDGKNVLNYDCDLPFPTTFEWCGVLYYHQKNGEYILVPKIDTKLSLNKRLQKLRDKEPFSKEVKQNMFSFLTNIISR